MQLSLYASLHFHICGIPTVASLKGLVISVYMPFLQLFDIQQWFLTRGTRLPRGCHFEGGASPYTLYNMESLSNKFINKYSCFYYLFSIMGPCNKRQLHKGSVVEKRFRTTDIESVTSEQL